MQDRDQESWIPNKVVYGSASIRVTGSL